MRAHPRSRGENEGITGTTPRWWGSSPLTRGKRMPVCVSDNRFRLIPAHAGKTDWSKLSVLAFPAHPRSRGENAKPAGVDLSAAGSSPLTRGKLASVVRVSPTLRLIPAHAGKTPHLRVRPGRHRAHPRSRGENVGHVNAWSETAGSSPLTRGKRIFAPGLRVRVGLIPAHAGKTRHRPGGCCRGGAHPRSRGENRISRLTGSGGMGSSPLTRGKLRFRLPEARRRGLIPAHAGKTRMNGAGR